MPFHPITIHPNFTGSIMQFTLDSVNEMTAILEVLDWDCQLENTSHGIVLIIRDEHDTANDIVLCRGDYVVKHGKRHLIPVTREVHKLLLQLEDNPNSTS